MTDDPPSSKLSTRKTWLDRIIHAFGGEPQDREELLETLRDAQQRNLFDNYALAMMEGVFAVMDEQVRDVMVPRSQMEVVEKDASLQEILAIVTPSGHSRFPVIGDSRDEVLGILLAKDLLQYVADSSQPFELQDVVRPAIFIPESKRLNTLLKEFRTSRNHMAIVVDEYGGVAGLVTIEDVLEQIVGEIDDEHDTEEDQNIKVEADNRYFVKALTEIEEFNEYFKSTFDDEEFDTIGGLILGYLGHMPKRGEEVEIEGFHFTVLGADSRRLHRLLVTRSSEDVSAASAAV
jgi:magnesium and cobalt transporter